MAVATKAYVFPDPAFGPGSKGYQMRTQTWKRIQKDETFGIEALRVDGQANSIRHGTVGDDSSDDDSNTEGTSTAARTYVGAGSYF